ncbi:MAG: pilin [Patescibacteria group bacterium]|nr:pilin [Patescibacteria group bacterium]
MFGSFFVSFGGYDVAYPQGFRWAGSDIGSIISFVLPYAFVLSGILLLFFLISGGFDLMTSAGDAKKTEQAKEKLTNALIGFIIVFASFWIYQIIKYILGIK